MKSRVHPQYKTGYRVSNWADYDRALVRRGDITLWISQDAIASWKPVPSGRRAAQRRFSDHAIEAALRLRLVFKLPLMFLLSSFGATVVWKRDIEGSQFDFRDDEAVAAQESRPLILSNLDVPLTSATFPLFDSQWYGECMTPPHDYRLTAVHGVYADIQDPWPNAALGATLHRANASGEPGLQLANLDLPADPSGVYGVPGDLILEAGQGYCLVMRATGISSNDPIFVRATPNPSAYVSDPRATAAPS